MRISALVVVLAILLISPISVIAKSDDVNVLLGEMNNLYDKGKYEEAIPLDKRALKLT